MDCRGAANAGASILDETLAVFDELHDEFGLAYNLWVASLLAGDTRTARSRAGRSEALFREFERRSGSVIASKDRR